MVTHKCVYLLEYPILLLGRDLLTKFRIQITFPQGETTSLTSERTKLPHHDSDYTYIMLMAVLLPGKGGPDEAHLPAGGVS
jgi:hypothetical protein